jgi:S-adenosylmethionine hydrolase
VKTGRDDRRTGRKGSTSPSLPVITLLTDFGTADYFVGAVKGAILSVNPSAIIADITHEIPPQDIAAGAFTLLAAYKTFPAGTIHVAVVDPGVGSARRSIIVSANEQFFVGPDNGLFTYIYDREPAHQIFHITSDRYFRPEPSSTFHGRDIFAPVAAALSNGVAPEEFGTLIDDEVLLAQSLKPVVQNDGKVRARIIHIDRFGNCITNITRDLVDGKKQPALLIKRRLIRTFKTFYADEIGSPNEPFAIWGSAGFLEISMNGQSAAQKLRAKRADVVILNHG